MRIRERIAEVRRNRKVIQKGINDIYTEIKTINLRATVNPAVLETVQSLVNTINDGMDTIELLDGIERVYRTEQERRRHIRRS